MRSPSHAELSSDIAAQQDNGAARMAARYGTDRPKWPSRVIASVAIIAFASTALWVGIQITDRPFEGQIIRSTPQGEQVVDLDLQVRGASTEPVQCVVRVKDSKAADVGYARVVLTDTPATQSFRLATVVRASSVEVLGCASVTEDLTVAPADFPPGVAAPSDTPLSH